MDSVTKLKEVENILKSCFGCEFYDPDIGCSCPVNEIWYACPLELEPTEDDFKVGEAN